MTFEDSVVFIAMMFYLLVAFMFVWIATSMIFYFLRGIRNAINVRISKARIQHTAGVYANDRRGKRTENFRSQDWQGGFNALSCDEVSRRQRQVDKDCVKKH